ncbi:kin of IRRE-like protein 3, partial [Eurytemora carolleeae]|uniref:kin of IRRE-like protein 3 n=1 Tax=Eurytemora carolleeae TaxID=1294199 RepID=UPI000C77AFC5
DWSLKISDVRLEDEGLYQCQVGGSGSSPPMKSREGNLTVYIEPDPPSVLQGGGSGVLSTGAGEWMELTCVSRNGKPPSTIDWLFMNSSTVQYDVRTRVEQMGRMFTTISTIKIKVGKELDGVVIVCQAQNRMDVTPQTTRISLDVEYPPDVKVVFDEASVREGEDLKISCLARNLHSK